MDPTLINFIDGDSILIVNPEGKMRQVFVPFPALVLHDTSQLKKNSRVRIEEVQSHEQYKIIYRVTTFWWPYYLFSIQINF